MPKAKKNAPNSSIDIDWTKVSEDAPSNENEGETNAQEEIIESPKPSTMICEDCNQSKTDCGPHYGKILCESCYQAEKEKKRLERLEKEKQEQEKLKSTNDAEIALLKLELSALKALIGKGQITKVPDLSKKGFWNSLVEKRGESGAKGLLNWLVMNKKHIGVNFDIPFEDNARGGSLSVIIDIFNEHLKKCQT